MKKRLLAVATAASFAASLMAPAFATPVGPKPVIHHYHHHLGGGHAGMKIVACALGGLMAWQSPEQSRVKNEILWDVGCVGGSFLNPAGGVIGGALLLTTLSDQGMITKFFRPGGWKCQQQDVGLVTGCKEYLEQVALESHHRHHH